AIAIEQSNPVKSSRSTVGTMTEINDYLKLLWPRVACAFCPTCGREIRPETAKSIAEQVLRDCDGKNVLIIFWVAVPAKTQPRDFFNFLQQQGYLRIWIDNEIVRVAISTFVRRVPGYSALTVHSVRVPNAADLAARLRSILTKRFRIGV